MNAARYFARSIQAFNRLVTFAKSLIVDINLNAAHLVMNARSNLNGVHIARLEFNHALSTTELIGCALGRELVVGVDGRLQGSCIDSRFL